MLEREVNSRRGNSNENESTTTGNTSTNGSSGVERQDSFSGGGELKYISGRVIPQQPMFLAAITKALEQHGQSRYSHTHWTALVIIFFTEALFLLDLSLMTVRLIQV